VAFSLGRRRLAPTAVSSFRGCGFATGLCLGKIKPHGMFASQSRSQGKSIRRIMEPPSKWRKNCGWYELDAQKIYGQVARNGVCGRASPTENKNARALNCPRFRNLLRVTVGASGCGIGLDGLGLKNHVVFRSWSPPTQASFSWVQLFRAIATATTLSKAGSAAWAKRSHERRAITLQSRLFSLGL